MVYIITPSWVCHVSRIGFFPILSYQCQVSLSSFCNSWHGFPQHQNALAEVVLDYISITQKQTELLDFGSPNHKPLGSGLFFKASVFCVVVVRGVKFPSRARNPVSEIRGGSQGLWKLG